MFNAIKSYVTRKYLSKLAADHKSVDEDFDIEYLNSLLKILEPEHLDSTLLGLNSKPIFIKSIHSNFEELLRNIVVVNSALEKSQLLFRNILIGEEKTFDLAKFMVNNKGQQIDFNESILVFKNLLLSMCNFLNDIKHSDKENDKLNKFYLKSYISYLCDFLNAIIKLQHNQT